MKALFKLLVLSMVICAALCGFAACDDQGGNNIPDNPEHTHNYIEVVAENPTCTTKGKKIYVCSCGKHYDEEINELGHDYGDWTVTKQPTDTEKGIESRVCSRCQDTLTRNIPELNHEHHYIETVVPLSCTTGGYVLHKCDCGAEYKTDETHATGHDYVWTTTKEPTETSNGTETGVCSRCGDIITRDIPKLNHEHNYTTSVIAPTCTTNGYTLHKCACGDEYYTDETDKLPHIPLAAEEENRVKATCTINGSYDLVVYCSVCHTELSRENKIIPATGHEFINYVSDGNATYEADGTKTAYCDNGCGAKDTVPDVGSKLVRTGITFKTLNVNGTNVSGKVANNVTTYSFLTEITATGNADFIVSYDISGKDFIPTKTAAINVGDNIFYVLEIVDGKATNLFTVNVRRREIYDVTFNANGGTAVAPQRVEEDSFATEPTTTRTGYTFTEWDYDFNKPITKNTAITASWAYYTLTTNVNNNKAGTITNHNYTKITAGESVTITATTNAGYTFNGWYNGETLLTNELSYQFIMPKENLSYTAKWTYYTLTTSVNNDMSGTATLYNQKMITAGESITLTATTNAGYTFNGWYNGETLLSNKLEYAFSMPNATVIYTAKWTANTNTKYKVEYYLQNLVDDNYTLDHTDNLTGTTDTTANAQIKTIKHFTHTVVSNSRESANINGNESTVLNVYYTRDKYTVKIQPQDEKISISTSYNGEFKYGYQINGTSLSSLYLGYDFTGWRNGGELITASNDILPFTVDKNVNLVASCILDEKMSNFEFSSTATSCTISGVKDDTITGIAIPNYVTSINSGAFNGCNNLATITVSDENANYSSVSGILYNKQKTQFVHIPSLISGSVIIPEGITSISDYFKNKNRIIGIEIPNMVVSVSLGALSGCSSLESITIPFVGANLNGTSYTHFGYVFGASSYSDNYYYVPSSLKTVEIRGGSSIKYGAFLNCDNLESVTIENGATIIDSYAFSGCSSLESITIPNSVTSIGEYAFYNCSSLESITIPNSVKGIEQGALANCSGLKSIIIPYVWRDNGQRHFSYFFVDSFTSTIPTSLKSVRINGGEIYDGAFSGCSNLTSVIIENGTKGIGDYAFYKCSSLTSITIGNSVTSIGKDAFDDCDSLTSIYYTGTASQWASIDGLENLMYLRTLYINNEPVTDVVLEDITEIKPYAFCGCRDLISITIPNSVSSIGYCAFMYCTSLEEITIPDLVTSIEGSTFYVCNSLKTITIPNSITKISDNAFGHAGNGAYIYIFYKGSAEEWEQINKLDTSWEFRYHTIRYYYSDTAPITGGIYWHYVDGEIVIWTKEN